MDPDLISKKDLLATAGISYGQLYRWKRKGLIPEEWFVRRSTFTGTETFFPRDKVLARIGKIQGMQSEDLSLDDIADVVAPGLAVEALDPAEVVPRGVASQASLDLFLEGREHPGPFVVDELLTLRTLDRLLRAGDITADEGRSLVRVMEDTHSGRVGRDVDAMLVRRVGYSAWLVVPAGCEVLTETDARIVARVNLTQVAEDLSSALR